MFYQEIVAEVRTVSCRDDICIQGTSQHRNIATLQQQQQKYELLPQENTMDNIGQWTFPNTQLRHTYWQTTHCPQVSPAIILITRGAPDGGILQS